MVHNGRQAWCTVACRLGAQRKATGNHDGGRRACRTARCWVRNLCEDGDVEPHPGPPRRGIRIVSLNTQGKENGWAAMQALISQKVDVICFQEINVAGRDRASFANHARHAGYEVFFAAAADNTAVTATLVRRTRRATCLAVWSHGEGELTVIDLDSVIVTNIYRHPTVPDRGLLRDELARFARADGRRRHFLAVGDWNRLPEDSEEIDLVEAAAPVYARAPDGSAIPTRWTGHRCIDWVLTNDQTKIWDVHLAEEKWSDHKLLSFRARYTREEETKWEQIPTKSYGRPQTVAVEAWREAIKAQWKDVTAEGIGITDTSHAAADYRRFAEVAEEKFQATFEALGLDRSAPPRTRPKGGTMTVEKHTAAVDRHRQTSPFKERKLRKALGRLLELERHARRDHGPGADPADVARLRRHIAETRIDGMQLRGTVREMIEMVSAELDKMTKETRQARLNEWCDNMRAGDKRVYRWIRGTSAQTGSHLHRDGDLLGRAANGVAQALQWTAEYWQQTWGRAALDVQAAMRHWRQGGVTAASSFVFAGFAPEALLKTARANPAGAAGPDGWMAEEAASLPLEAWRIFAKIANKMIEKGQYPSAFREIRQVHIPKEGARVRETDGAAAVSDTRPIAIEAVLWRVMASTLASDDNLRSWVEGWVPLAAHGGIPGRGVHTAAFELERRLDEDSILVSMDLEKAFDTVDPVLACEVFKELGLDQRIIAMLLWIWTGQRRYLCMGNELIPEPVDVATSLPQGDAFSPLALLAVLAGPTLEIMRTLEPGETLITFLDDRNFMTKKARRVIELIELWKKACTALGLRENFKKLRIVTRSAAARRELVAAGLEEHIVGGVRVLGLDYSVDGSTKTADERVRQACIRIRKVASLKVSFKLRRQLCRTSALTKATWGKWRSSFRKQDAAKIKNALRQALWQTDTIHARELASILTGHQLDPDFMAGDQAMTMLAKAVQQAELGEYGIAPAGPQPDASLQKWAKRVDDWMGSLGWVTTSRGCWRLPGSLLSLGWATFLGSIEEHRHLLRECWRKACFHRFLESGRRDAAALKAAGTNYVEGVCKRARQLFADGDGHERTVLTGGVVSDAYLSAQDTPDGVPVPWCGWCLQPVTPSWTHAAWECTSDLAAGRPRRPETLLQERLGWPCSGDAAFDGAVLKYLADVRARLLSRRHVGIPRRLAAVPAAS